jgi:hypothetical protein
MLIGFRQPKTKDNMKTNDDVTTSAPTLANTMLVAVFISLSVCQPIYLEVKR